MVELFMMSRFGVVQRCFSYKREKKTHLFCTGIEMDCKIEKQEVSLVNNDFSFSFVSSMAQEA